MRQFTIYIFICLGLMLIGCSTSDPFAEEVAAEQKVFSVQDAFKIIAKENEETRTLYTAKVVGLGKKAGINFHEDWQKPDVEAGPLPALFLRGTSNEIQKTDVPLGLYLGSDFPIVKANKFVGVQAEKFEKIRATKAPEFFYDEENELHTAMFPDFAGAGPCVTCHNGHKNTPKTDWALGDIMGATTWTYPEDSLSVAEMLDVVSAYRQGVQKTYNTFLAEVKGFKQQDVPEIADDWSSAGYVVPSVDKFQAAVDEKVGGETFREILAFVDKI